MSSLQEDNLPKSNSYNIQAELNEFENKLLELKILYEQYFCGLLPLEPEMEFKEVKMMVRRLLKIPFKNSQTNFRLKQLVLRFQTLSTYWARVMKQREDGTYKKDVFRANLRSRTNYERKVRSKESDGPDSRYKELFSSYNKALVDSGLNNKKLDFETFKNRLKNRASDLSSQNGGRNVSFRVEVTAGKVTIKAKVKD